MATLKQLRLQAHLTVAELARRAGVDRKTVERAEGGRPVLDAKAYMIVEALGKQLGREIQLEDSECHHPSPLLLQPLTDPPSDLLSRLSN